MTNNAIAMKTAIKMKNAKKPDISNIPKKLGRINMKMIPIKITPPTMLDCASLIWASE